MGLFDSFKETPVQGDARNDKLDKAQKNLFKAIESLNDAYRDLGMEYFYDHESDGGEYPDLISKIKQAEEYSELSGQYCLSLNGEQVCQSCDAIITISSVFCNKCGKPLPKWDFSPVISQINAQNVSKCPQCGSDVSKDAVFCEKCGNKLKY